MGFIRINQLIDQIQTQMVEYLDVLTETDPPFRITNFGDVGRVISETGGFAACETALFRHFLKSQCEKDINTLVVDVGANIGFFSLYSAAMGCRVESFEPTPLPSSFEGRLLLLTKN